MRTGQSLCKTSRNGRQRTSLTTTALYTTAIGVEPRELVRPSLDPTGDRTVDVTCTFRRADFEHFRNGADRL